MNSDDFSWRDMTPVTSDYEVQINTRTGEARHRRRQAYGPVGYLRNKNGPVADLPWTPGMPTEGK